MGHVVLPSMLESRESYDRDMMMTSGHMQESDGVLMGGKHRRHHTDPEPLPVPAAVTAGVGEDETIAMSELTLDSNLQQKRARKESTFKKAMLFVSPANKSSHNKTPKLPAPSEKLRFFNKFGSNQSSPVYSPDPKSALDDSTAVKSWPGDDDTPKSGKSKKKNILRRAFGGKTEDSDKMSGASSQSSEKGRRKNGRLSKHHGKHSDTDDEESAAQSMCVRIQVIAKSKYRLCNLDPQNEHDDNWAVITGNFHQVFFLKSNSNGRPSVSDRLITAKIDKV